MTAEISLTVPQGGKHATVTRILQALAEAGVGYGIDEAAVLQACASGQADHAPVAHAVRPENGHDTVFQALVPEVSDRAPKIDANGLIDYREHGGIIVVQAGDPLMRRIPPTQGVMGHTVLGRELPARAGLDAAFATSLTGVQVAMEDSNLLKASVAGQPVLVSQGVMVEPVLHLPEVNLASGNIYFDGTVQIDGEVAHGMKVQAKGDIVVGGTVDGALLEAGGDIRVAGGIIAQAQVRAEGAVSARFGENCSIQAGTVIALEDMALECGLESRNQIIVGEKAPKRGRLVGGHATAMMLIRTPLLGSDKGGLTRVKVGANAELEAQMQALQLRLETEKTHEENLSKLMKQLAATGDPKGLLERVKASWQQAVQVWSKSLAERTELEKQWALMLTAKVEVGVGGVAGPLDLAFGSTAAHVRKEYSQGVFSFAPETGVVWTDQAGRVTPIA
ncbi:MAG: FapA family protein [Pseudomonadota bacterium]